MAPWHKHPGSLGTYIYIYMQHTHTNTHTHTHTLSPRTTPSKQLHLRRECKWRNLCRNTHTHTHMSNVVFVKHWCLEEPEQPQCCLHGVNMNRWCRDEQEMAAGRTPHPHPPSVSHSASITLWLSSPLPRLRSSSSPQLTKSLHSVVSEERGNELLSLLELQVFVWSFILFGSGHSPDFHMSNKQLEILRVRFVHNKRNMSVTLRWGVEPG